MSRRSMSFNSVMTEPVKANSVKVKLLFAVIFVVVLFFILLWKASLERKHFQAVLERWG